MTLNDILMMRHELLLTITALLVLAIDLAMPDHKRPNIIPIAMLLFGATLVIGFFPVTEGLPGVPVGLLILLLKNSLIY